VFYPGLKTKDKARGSQAVDAIAASRSGLGHGERLFLLPVTGSHSQCRRNLLTTPAIGLASGFRPARAAPFRSPLRMSSAR
jgi:hypothetical protein